MVDWLDEVRRGWLLLPNGFIAILVLLAHGGALILVRLGKIPASDFGDRLDYAYVTIVPAAAVLLLALLAWVRPATRSWVLKVHAVVLLCLAMYALYFALNVIANGIPKGDRFTWDAALFAFVVAYPVYLARRTLIHMPRLANPVIRYAHVIAVVIAIGVSLLVFWRMDGAAA
jgi:hypothetical protein